MIDEKRLAELRQKYHDLNPSWNVTIWGDAMEDILSSLEALWRVARAADYIYRHGGMDAGMVGFTQIGSELAALKSESRP